MGWFWFLGFCFGVWGQGLTKELGLEPEGIVSELESMTNDRTYGVEPIDTTMIWHQPSKQTVSVCSAIFC